MGVDPSEEVAGKHAVNIWHDSNPDITCFWRTLQVS
jgi:hypothetical protein